MEEVAGVLVAASAVLLLWKLSFSAKYA